MFILLLSPRDWANLYPYGISRSTKFSIKQHLVSVILIFNKINLIFPFSVLPLSFHFIQFPILIKQWLFPSIRFQEVGLLRIPLVWVKRTLPGYVQRWGTTKVLIFVLEQDPNGTQKNIKFQYTNTKIWKLIG